MNLWHAVILGLVEGITEYLPVSSTGHLILTAALLGINDPENKSAIDAFTIVVQGGAILAVLGLYRARVAQMIRGALGVVRIGPGDAKGLRLLANLIIAFIPAAVLGLLLDDWIEARLFHPGPVIAALALGGIFMMWLDGRRSGRLSTPRPTQAERDLDDLTPVRALIIGLLQCVAMWPGTSRSMMTIGGGFLVGLRPKAAAEFSFLLGLPTLGAATIYKLAKNLKESADAGVPNMFEQLGVMSCVVGILVAMVSAAAAVKWLVSFLNRHGLTPFGWYRLFIAAVMLGLVLSGYLSFGA